MHAVRTITREAFWPYGWVIEYPDKALQPRDKTLFTVILREKKKVGWRIGYLLQRDRQLRRLEQHPDSFETFEPVAGKTLLYVSDRKDKKHIVCFRLDPHVILKKGIWHDVVTLGKESEIKICENSDVQCRYWPLSGV